MVKKRNLVTGGFLFVFGSPRLLVWVVSFSFCASAKPAVAIPAGAVGAVLSGRLLRRCIGLFVAPNSLFQ